MAQFSNYFSTEFNDDANPQEDMEFKTEPPDDDTTGGAYDCDLDEGMLVVDPLIIKGGGGDWSNNDGEDSEEDGVTLKHLLRRVKMLEEQQMVAASVDVGSDVENQDLVHQLYAKCNSLEERFNKWRLEVNKRLRLLDGRKTNGTTFAQGRKRKGTSARVHAEVSPLDVGGSTSRKGQHYESQRQLPSPTSASSSRKSHTSLTATANSREYRRRSRSRPRYSVENSSTADVSPNSASVPACPACNQAFTNKVSQQSHTAKDCARKIRARENYLRALERNACSICSRGFTSLATLREHEKRDHGLVISKYKLKKLRKRRRSTTARPSSGKSGDDTAEGNLEDCSPHGTQRSRGPAATETEPHISVTSGSTTFLCPEEGCGCFYRTPKLLERHLTFCRRLQNRYKCPHCEKSFGFKAKLQLHQLGAHPHPPDSTDQNGMSSLQHGNRKEDLS